MAILRKAIAITPADGANLPEVVRALVCTGAGTVKMTLVGNDDADAITLTLAANTLLEGLLIKKVFATGTSALGIYGLTD